MIIVTGANGKLGRAVVQALLARDCEVGVSVREPDRAQTLEALGVRVRKGTFTDAGSLRHAFEGATRILVVSSGTTAGDTMAQHRTAIEAARASGAARIVYTSHMGSSATSLFPPMRNHAATEALLQASGMAYTSLRNGFYAASALMFLGAVRETGELVAPADGSVSWTAHADLAEAAAIALTTDQLDGISPALTGSEALDLASVAAIVTNKPVARVVVGDDEFRAGLVARKLPPIVVEISMGLYAASRAGEFATVDPTLERLLGRKPLTMRDIAR